MTERSEEEIDAMIEEAEALEVADHAAFMGDAALLREAVARIATARDRTALARHLRLGDAIDEELRRLGVRGSETTGRRIGVRERWPALIGFALRPFERIGPALARDQAASPRGVDTVSVGPVTVERASLSKTEMVVRLRTPHEWVERFLALEIGEPPDLLPYLVAVFAHGKGGAGVLRLRTRAKMVAMQVATRPLAGSELGPPHTQAIDRSVWGLPPEAAALWRRAAERSDVNDAVRKAIISVLGPG